MSQLSLVLIVKNEGDSLADCLSSCVDIVDEIIILDSGSSDNTLEIAKQFTDKIYSNTDWPGFGKQRQLAQTYAKNDWILVLDADERLTPEIALEIKSLVEANNQNCVYYIPRMTWTFGSFAKHSTWFPDYVARVYPRKKAEYNDKLVHESLIVDDSLTKQKLKNYVLHYSFKNLTEYLTKLTRYSDLWAKQKVIEGKKTTILKAFGHSTWCFMRMYIFRLGFLDGSSGFLFAIATSHYVFSKYASLWLLNKEKQ